MTSTTQALCVLTILLTISHPAAADSILVGSDISNPAGGGPSLCPSDSDCSMLIQQFTLFAPVLIDDIKVVIGASSFVGPGLGGGSFSLALSNLTTSMFVGSGSLPQLGPNPLNQSEMHTFDFSGLNISLAPGTYYLFVNGGALYWNEALPLSFPTGALTQAFECDPTIHQCDDPSRWDSLRGGSFAMQISGEATPEPSSWLLMTTGLLASALMWRRNSLPIR